MARFETLVRTYKNAFISVALIIFCVMAAFFAIIPAARKTIEAFGELKRMNEQTSILQKKLDTLQSLSEDTLRHDLSTVLSAVPFDRSFATLFETVEGIANRTGVSITDMSISGSATLATPSASKLSATDKKLGTRTIPFSVAVTGPLPSIEQFITLVPGVRRLLRIRVFSITFPKSERPVSIMIDLDGFYEPLPTNIGAVKATLPTLSEADTNVIARLVEMPLIAERVEGGQSFPPPLIGKVKEDPFAP